MSITDKLTNIDTDEFVAAMIETLKERGVEFYDRPVDEKDVDPEIKRIMDSAFSFIDNGSLFDERFFMTMHSTMLKPIHQRTLKIGGSKDPAPFPSIVVIYK